ncbi:ribbon-helix-helix protein, CopG family [Halocalculus aciditolerans]|nr:ribbon-helix-helix protein, CopG family [Halocalculus aciditolerans]
MPQERVTVSLDADAKAALTDLVERTDAAQSEVVRRALSFYATNFEAATAAETESDENLSEYHRMLAGGEHVLLDVDFLHAFLDTVDVDDPEEAFIETVDRVSEYHAHEYAERFDDVGELLDWLALCGFLTVRRAEGDTYHIVFPSEEMRWFMMRFIRKSTTEVSFGVEVEEGVSKVLVRERRP